MTKLCKVNVELVGDIPEKLHPGIVYVSRQHRTAMHLCCCGCGREVVTPLSPAAWSARIEGRLVTIYPSIGNASFPCQSHYWIRRGRVQWATPWTKGENSLGWQRDRALEAEYLSTADRENQGWTEEGVVVVRQGIWDWLKRLLFGR
jgi:hypothetical protein